MGRAGPGEESSGPGLRDRERKRRTEVGQARARTDGFKKGRGRCPGHPVGPEL